jgi:hypothetical protein
MPPSLEFMPSMLLSLFHSQLLSPVDAPGIAGLA